MKLLKFFFVKIRRVCPVPCALCLAYAFCLLPNALYGAASVRATPGANIVGGTTTGAPTTVAPSSVSSVRAGVLSSSPTRVSSAAASASAGARRSSVYEYIRNNSGGIAAGTPGGSAGGGNIDIDLSAFVPYAVYDPKMSGIDTEINSIWEHPTLGINAIWNYLQEQGDTKINREEVEEIVLELLSDPAILAEFRGEQGLPGLQGEQGPQGEKGDPGENANMPDCQSQHGPGDYALVQRESEEIVCVRVIYPAGI